jgi:hypothetical protein
MYMSDETIYYLPKVDIAWGHNPPLLFSDVLVIWFRPPLFCRRSVRGHIRQRHKSDDHALSSYYSHQHQALAPL